MKKTIAIDFDGVIHSNGDGWKNGILYGEPIHGSLTALKRLEKEGFEVVIFTARTKFEPVYEWLADNGFPHYQVTNTKIPAMVYIDDRGVRFTNWRDMLCYFVQQI